MERPPLPCYAPILFATTCERVGWASCRLPFTFPLNTLAVTTKSCPDSFAPKPLSVMRQALTMKPVLGIAGAHDGIWTEQNILFLHFV